MPIYKVQGPDGRVHRFEGPEGASQQEVLAFAQQHFSGQPQQVSADAIAAGTQRAKDQRNALAAERLRLQDEMMAERSYLENKVASFANAFDDTWLGIKQYAGLATDEEVEEDRRLDEPLNNSGGGLIGSILGYAAQTILPGTAAGSLGRTARLANMPRLARTADRVRAAALPTSFGGNVAQGGAIGYLQPVVEGESRMANAAIGATAGGIGYAIPAVVQTGKRVLVDPFTKSGRDRIVGETLQNFATDPKALLNPAKSDIPGLNYTLAEATGDPGIAALQRGAMSDARVGGPLSSIMKDNNVARVRAIESIAGQSGDLAAATAARRQAVDELYGTVEGARVLVDDEFRALMSRPSIKQGIRDAQRIAKEAGVQLPKSSELMTGQHLQFIDQALSRQISKEIRAAGKTSALGQRLQDTQTALRAWMSKQLPEYMQAQGIYSQMSKPIDQMKIGRQVLKQGRGGASDIETGAPILRPDATMRAINELDTVAQRATRFRGARADQILTDQQLAQLRSVSDSLSRLHAANTLGRAAGTDTAQKLSTQGLLGQAGLPEPLTNVGTVGAVVRAADAGLKAAGVPERLQGRLVELLANPDEAARILKGLPDKDRQLLLRALSAQAMRAPALAED